MSALLCLGERLHNDFYYLSFFGSIHSENFTFHPETPGRTIMGKLIYS